MIVLQLLRLEGDAVFFQIVIFFDENGAYLDKLALPHSDLFLFVKSGEMRGQLLVTVCPFLFPMLYRSLTGVLLINWNCKIAHSSIIITF